jgi:hypothetical protein
VELIYREIRATDFSTWLFIVCRWGRLFIGIFWLILASADYRVCRAKYSKTNGGYTILIAWPLTGVRHISSNATSATLSSDVTEGASVIKCSQSVSLMPALGAVYSAVAEGRLKITPQTQLGRAQTYQHYFLAVYCVTVHLSDQCRNRFSKMCTSITSIDKGKGKFHPRTGHEGPEGEYRCA